MKELAVFIVIFSIGWYFGYAYAHLVVAVECDRLGGFYVGKRVFRCVDSGAGDADAEA